MDVGNQDMQTLRRWSPVVELFNENWGRGEVFYAFWNVSVRNLLCFCKF